MEAHSSSAEHTHEPDPSMVQAVAAAYYAKEVAAPSASRERAQRSYTIAGAVATTLLAAGVFTDLSSQPTIVKLIALLTLAAWVVVAVLFTRAIASPIQHLTEQERSDATAFVRSALDKARRERDELDELMKQAQAGAFVAAVLTIVTLLLALFLPVARTAVTVVLSPRGIASVHTACPKWHEHNPLDGEIEPDLVTGGFITIHVAPSECAGENRALSIRKDDVLAMRPSTSTP